jgi:hypothetical protein
MARRDRDGILAGMLIPEELVVAELRLTLGRLDDWPLLRSMLSLACDRAISEEGRVRYVGGTYLPADRRLICLFATPTVDAVAAVVRSTDLQVLWVGPAVALPDLDPERDAA